MLEEALATVLRLTPAPALTVAGRTDAGVHARGQVCHVDLPGSPGQEPFRPAGRTSLLRRLNGVLPGDVVVHRLEPAPAGFDARFSAVARRYAYRLVDDPSAADPLQRHVVAVNPRPLDVGAMASAATALQGEHDFVAYCRRREGATTIRTVRRLECRRSPDRLVVVEVEADAFCHQMVRSLVGALVAVGEGRRETGWPAELLRARQRESSVAVMPAHGLTLEEVRYPPAEQLAARAAETRAVRQHPPVGTEVTPPPRSD